jgi:lysophospholipase L1-like esterase
MKRARAILIATACLFGLGSVALNIVLLRAAKSFYVQLQAVRLDPLGCREQVADPFARSPEGATRLLVVGDSRAMEWPATEDEAGISFATTAVGNQTTAQVLARLPGDLARTAPDVVLIQTGVNDLKAIPLFPRRRAEIVTACRENLHRMVECSARDGRTVIVSTIFPVGRPVPARRLVWSPEIAEAIREVNAFLKTLAGPDVVILDAHAILRGGDGHVQRAYARDTLHLNPRGYEALNRELTAILQRHREPPSNDASGI